MFKIISRIVNILLVLLIVVLLVFTYSWGTISYAQFIKIGLLSLPIAYYLRKETAWLIYLMSAAISIGSRYFTLNMFTKLYTEQSLIYSDEVIMLYISILDMTCITMYFVFMAIYLIIRNGRYLRDKKALNEIKLHTKKSSVNFLFLTCFIITVCLILSMIGAEGSIIIGISNYIIIGWIVYFSSVKYIDAQYTAKIKDIGGYEYLQSKAESESHKDIKVENLNEEQEENYNDN